MTRCWWCKVSVRNRDALLAQDAGFDLRSWAGALPWGAESAQMGHLGRLAEAAFTASGGQSFWVPMERRQAAAGVLEAFAAAVFDFHTAGGVDGVEIDLRTLTHLRRRELLKRSKERAVQAAMIFFGFSFLGVSRGRWSSPR